MKETVLDINDLGEMAPFFKTKFGVVIGKLLIQLMKIDKVNQVHKNSCHLRGADFTSALLKDPLINISYRLHNKEILDSLPEGSFITVSNHPIGSLDGIMLIDIIAKRRPDFKVMVNNILSRIGAMNDNFISVQPNTKRDGKGDSRNMNGVRLCLSHMKEGHPIGFFPAGAMSFYNKEAKAVRDLPWTRSVIHLIAKANLPVYPIYFGFQNSKFFYFLGWLNWKLRTLCITSEVFNKKGRTVDVFVGKPIPPEKIKSFTNDKDLAQYLYDQTYSCGS